MQGDFANEKTTYESAIIITEPTSLPIDGNTGLDIAPAAEPNTKTGVDPTNASLLKEHTHVELPPNPPAINDQTPYCAYSPARRRFLLFLIALSGTLGPLAGNIYVGVSDGRTFI